MALVMPVKARQLLGSSKGDSDKGLTSPTTASTGIESTPHPSKPQVNALIDGLRHHRAVWNALQWQEARQALIDTGSVQDLPLLMKSVRESTLRAMQLGRYETEDEKTVELASYLTPAENVRWLGRRNVSVPAVKREGPVGVAVEPPMIVVDMSVLDVVSHLHSLSEEMRQTRICITVEVSDFRHDGDICTSADRGLTSIHQQGICVRTDFQRFAAVASRYVRHGTCSVRDHLTAKSDPYVFLMHGLTMFRGPREDGYPFLDEPTQLSAVVYSMASPRPAMVRTVHRQTGEKTEWYSSDADQSALLERLSLICFAALENGDPTKKGILIINASGVMDRGRHPLDAVANSLKHWRSRFAQFFHTVFLACGPDEELAETLDLTINRQVYAALLKEDASQFVDWHWDRSLVAMHINDADLHGVADLWDEEREARTAREDGDKRWREALDARRREQTETAAEDQRWEDLMLPAEERVSLDVLPQEASMVLGVLCDEQSSLDHPEGLEAPLVLSASEDSDGGLDEVKVRISDAGEVSYNYADASPQPCCAERGGGTCGASVSASLADSFVESERPIAEREPRLGSKSSLVTAPRSHGSVSSSVGQVNTQFSLIEDFGAVASARRRRPSEEEEVTNRYREVKAFNESRRDSAAQSRKGSETSRKGSTSSRKSSGWSAGPFRRHSLFELCRGEQRTSTARSLPAPSRRRNSMGACPSASAPSSPRRPRRSVQFSPASRVGLHDIMRQASPQRAGSQDMNSSAGSLPRAPRSAGGAASAWPPLVPQPSSTSPPAPVNLVAMKTTEESPPPPLSARGKLQMETDLESESHSSISGKPESSPNASSVGKKIMQDKALAMTLKMATGQQVAWRKKRDSTGVCELEVSQSEKTRQETRQRLLMKKGKEDSPAKSTGRGLIFAGLAADDARCEAYGEGEADADIATAVTQPPSSAVSVQYPCSAGSELSLDYVELMPSLRHELSMASALTSEAAEHAMQEEKCSSSAESDDDGPLPDLVSELLVFPDDDQPQVMVTAPSGGPVPPSKQAASSATEGSSRSSVGFMAAEVGFLAKSTARLARSTTFVERAQAMTEFTVRAETRLLATQFRNQAEEFWANPRPRQQGPSYGSKAKGMPKARMRARRTSNHLRADGALQTLQDMMMEDKGSRLSEMNALAPPPPSTRLPTLSVPGAPPSVRGSIRGSVRSSCISALSGDADQDPDKTLSARDAEKAAYAKARASRAAATADKAAAAVALAQSAAHSGEGGLPLELPRLDEHQGHGTLNSARNRGTGSETPSDGGDSSTASYNISRLMPVPPPGADQRKSSVRASILGKGRRFVKGASSFGLAPLDEVNKFSIG